MTQPTRSRARRLAAVVAMLGVGAVSAILVTVAVGPDIGRSASPAPELVSVAATGTGPQAGTAREPSIAADGSAVAYTVDAAGGAPAVFVRNRATPAVAPVQVPLPSGVTVAEHPAISGDGCVVAFWGLTAAPGTTAATARLFTWKRCPAASAAAEPVVPTTALALTGVAALARPALSTNGAAIAYAAAPAAGGPWHVGLVALGATTEQSVAAQPPILALTTIDLSGDGATVVFDAGTDPAASPSAVYQWKPGGTPAVAPALVSAKADGTPAGGVNAMPTVSDDGTTIAFVSNSPDLANVTAPTLQLYVRTPDQAFHLVSGTSPNTPQTGNVLQPDLTPDGRQVAYTLETAATSAVIDVPVAQASSVVVARFGDGFATILDQISAVGGVPVGGTSSAPAISASGRFTVYESDAGASLTGNAQFPAGVQIWSSERTLSVAATTDFGTVDVGSSSAAVAIPLTNPLAAPVTVGQIAPPGSGFAIGPDTCSNQILAAGATCVVTVVFTPTAAGAVSANLVVDGGDQTATSVLKATGRQLRRALTIDNSTLQFPTTAAGGRGGPLAATVRNTGDVPVTIAAAAVQGSAAAQFSVVGSTCAGQSLAVDATCAVSVVALPSSAGTKQASLVVTGSNGETASAALSVVAVSPTTTTTTVRPPPTTARTTTTTMARPGQLVASPSSISFPTTPVDTTSTPLTVTVSNAGGASVSITEVSISGGSDQFSVSDDSCSGAQLSGARTCTVSVVVSPVAGGEVTATLTIGGSRGESTNVALLVDSSYAPTIALAPGVVRRGDLVTVRGANFPADRAVVLQLTSAAGPGPALPLGGATADAAGAFVAAVIIPQNGIASGGWRVVVVDQTDFSGVGAPLLVDQSSASPGAATGAAGIGGVPRPGPVLP